MVQSATEHTRQISRFKVDAHTQKFTRRQLEDGYHLQCDGGGTGGNGVLADGSLLMNADVHTFQFASRAKSIQNKPVKNAIVTDKALLKKYETEVEDLKRQIEFVGRQT